MSGNSEKRTNYLVIFSAIIVGYTSVAVTKGKANGYKWMFVMRLPDGNRNVGIVRFTEESEAPDYLEWLRQNPLGFVLNINH